jgi:uncharacterized UPF0160 family protein
MDFTEYEKIIVHNGRPHFDDCMCVAMMKILNPDIIVERKSKEDVLDENVDEHTIVCDVGLGKYDHHQDEDLVERHLDGSKYCACTLLYRDIKDYLFINKAVQSQFEQILSDIEITDNTGKLSNFTIYSRALAPTPGEKESDNVTFNRMVDFLYDFTKNAISLDEKFNEFYTNQSTLEHQPWNIDYDLFNIVHSSLIKVCEKYKLTDLKEYVINCEKLEDFNNLKTIEPKYIGGFAQNLIDNFNVEYIKYFLAGQLFENVETDLSQCTKNEGIENLRQLCINCDKMANEFTNQISKFIEGQIAIYEINRKLKEEIIPGAENHIIVFDEGCPWKAACIETDILFAIMPDSRTPGNYSLQTSQLFNNVNKKDIPLELANNEDCIFVHPNQFLASFTSKEAALNAANKLVNDTMKDLPSIFNTFYDTNNINTIQNLSCALNTIKIIKNELNLDKKETIKQVFNFIEDQKKEDVINKNNYNTIFYTLCEYSKNDEIDSNTLVNMYKENMNLVNYLQLNDDKFIYNNTNECKFCTKSELDEKLNDTFSR